MPEMIDTIYANVAAARLELSEITDPPMQVRDALKRLSDVIELITSTNRNEARDRWVENDACSTYTASILAEDRHNLHCRAWSELSDEEKAPWRAASRDEWDRD